MDELTNNNTSEKKSGIRAKVAGLAEYMHKGCIGMIIISAVELWFLLEREMLHAKALLLRS